jgi:hypothetical protein
MLLSRGANSDKEAWGSRVTFVELLRDRESSCSAGRAAVSTGVFPAALTLDVISFIWSTPSRIGQLRPVLPMTSINLRREP